MYSSPSAAAAETLRAGTPTSDPKVAMALIRRLGAALLRLFVDLGYQISPVPLPERTD
ncbi:hypothetical protein GCM10022255_008940 [Dactylosporangium darangshiense]|uniref:Uncharacterized protein n=1 Tax=Dactylosporangium darangshiense TaxID=579108 RepID=A0ABP8CXT5_9ACTN